jgi:predicted Rossmann fold flavoprotein
MDFCKVDIAVVGAGAAGSMAAIRAGSFGKRVLLIERNPSIGKKILLTSNGRCNFTNIASLELFLKKIRPNGQFYRDAFGKFFNKALIDFFEQYGVKHKVEERGRVLPGNNNAKAVNAALEKALSENKVEILYDCRVSAIRSHHGEFILSADGKDICAAKKVILAAGGISYPATGSTGDSFSLARSLGHSVSELRAALAPLKLNEIFLKDLQGLSFSDVTLNFTANGKKYHSDKGDILFTHFGLSGPLALDISAEVDLVLEQDKQVKILVDFLPDAKADKLEQDIFKACDSSPKTQIKTILEKYLPKRMAPVFLARFNIDAAKQANQATKKERQTIAYNLKNFSLTVNGVFPVEEAMVTNGGILLKEIDPRTMESRLVPGLYFAGELLEGYCLSGGYNLQQAFSTGYLAGESAAL